MTISGKHRHFFLAPTLFVAVVAVISMDVCLCYAEQRQASEAYQKMRRLDREIESIDKQISELEADRTIGKDVPSQEYINKAIPMYQKKREVLVRIRKALKKRGSGRADNEIFTTLEHFYKTPDTLSGIVPKKAYTIQVYASRFQDKAKAITETLKENGFDAYYTYWMTDTMGVYRVRIGVFQHYSGAVTELNDIGPRLSAMGYPDWIIVRYMDTK